MTIRANEIIDTVAMLRSISRQELIGQGRSAVVVAARHELHYALRQLTRLSFAEIGRAVGKDHTCVVSSINRVEKQRAEDPDFAQQNDALLQYLREMDHSAPSASALDADASCLTVARQATGNPSSLTLPEVQALGIALLTLSSVVTADHLTDEEARRAIRVLLTSCNPKHPTSTIKIGA